jgi:hypothetical protein
MQRYIITGPPCRPRNYIQYSKYGIPPNRTFRYGIDKMWYRNYAPVQRHRSPHRPRKYIPYSKYGIHKLICQSTIFKPKMWYRYRAPVQRHYGIRNTIPIRCDIEIMHGYNVTGLPCRPRNYIQYSKYGIPPNRTFRYGIDKMWYRNYAPVQRHRSPHCPRKYIQYSKYGIQKRIKIIKIIKIRKIKKLYTVLKIRYSKYDTNKMWFRNCAPPADKE